MLDTQHLAGDWPLFAVRIAADENSVSYAEGETADEVYESLTEDIRADPDKYDGEGCECFINPPCGWCVEGVSETADELCSDVIEGATIDLSWILFGWLT